ncbi:MAG: VWA domain-containing protein [Proteobacteria bacterium]|nr:VWA domain-containing protein [Pseudomonadota bacterium]
MGKGQLNPVSIAVVLHGETSLNSLRAANHEIIIDEAGDQRTLVTLAEGSVITDGDFVLSWEPKSGNAPAVSVFAEEVDGDSHLLVTVAPPHAGSWPAGTLPRDLILVLDKSGSMNGPAMEQTKRAAAKSLSRLTPDDRFNVIAFDDQPTPLFHSVRAANRQNLRQALNMVHNMNADGGTEMVSALKNALLMQPPEGRLRQIVFMTDGAVSNEAGLFELIGRELGKSRLFTVGLGSAPNSHLMVRAAEMGRGSYTYINNPAEIDSRIAALSQKLEKPALTDLRLAWSTMAVTIGEVFPRVLPALYIGEPIGFTIRLPDITLDKLPGEIELSGTLGAKTWRQNIMLSDAKSAAGVAALWARQKIADLNSESWRPGERSEKIRAEVIQTAIRYQLVTPHTSLVAVDDAEVIRPPEAPLQVTEVERNLPRGMNYEKIFGPRELKEMRMSPVPLSLLQEASFRRAIGLPSTATPAERMLTIGVILLFLGVMTLLFLWVGALRAGAKP